jgi:anti-sigma B factor antagonist
MTQRTDCQRGRLFTEGGKTVTELLSLAIESEGSSTTVRVGGEIDLDTAPQLRACLATLAGDVVVDLSEVSFVDSQAIGLLIAEHRRRTDAGGRLVVRGASPMTLRTFELTGVDQVLDLDGDSPGEAPFAEPAA